MTETLFRADAYTRTCEAFVTAVNDRGGIVLDRTILYAAAGGQPGDGGALTWEGGVCRIATTVYDADKTTIVHVPAEGSAMPAAGLPVHVALDWDTRHRHMRVHTAWFPAIAQDSSGSLLHRLRRWCNTVDRSADRAGRVLMPLGSLSKMASR